MWALGPRGIHYVIKFLTSCSHCCCCFQELKGSEQVGICTGTQVPGWEVSGCVYKGGPVRLSPATPGLLKVKLSIDKSTSRSPPSVCPLKPTASHLAVFRPQVILIPNLLLRADARGVSVTGVCLPLLPGQVCPGPGPQRTQLPAELHLVDCLENLPLLHAHL